MLALARSVSLPRVLVVLACTALALPLATPADAAGATVDSLSPAYGPVGALVDITGSGLATASDVMFNGTDAGAPTVVDDTHLQATVPSGATTADGTVNGPSFSVQLPTYGRVTLSAADVVFPATSRVSATLTADGFPVRDQRAQLQRNVRGTHTWIDTRKAQRTGSHGKVRWRVGPRDTTSYRVVFSDSTGYLGTTTKPARLHIHPQVKLDVPEVGPILTAITIKGTVRPKPDQGHVVIQRRQSGGDWHRVARVPVGGAVHFSFTTSFDSTGNYAFRARRPSDATHGAGHSSIGRIRRDVRTRRPRPATTSHCVALRRRRCGRLFRLRHAACGGGLPEGQRPQP